MGNYFLTPKCQINLFYEQISYKTTCNIVNFHLPLKLNYFKSEFEYFKFKCENKLFE